MKKKFAFLVIVVLLCLSVLAGCSGKTTGRYYYVLDNGSLDKDSWIELKSGGEWVDNDDNYGTYKVDGDTVTFYVENIEFFNGKLSDGELEVSIFGMSVLKYRKETASSGSNSGGGGGGGTQTPAPEVKIYTVSFDSVGGSSISSVKVKEGEKLNAPYKPTKNSFNFSGWYKDSQYTKLWDFSTDIVTSDITLYARWSAEEGKIIAVTNASIDGNNILMVVGEYTDYVDLSGAVTIGGNATWELYYDRMGQTKIPTKIAAGLNGGLKDGDNVFYIVATTADGQQARTYELTVHRQHYVMLYGQNASNGSRLGEKSVLTYQTVDSLSSFTPTGYTVTKYSQATGESFVLGAYGTVVKESMIVRVHLTPNNYTVTFDLNGGTLSEKTKDVTFDSSYKLPVPTKTGYNFVGWYSYYNGSKINLTDSYGSSKSIWKYSSNMTLYADWQLASFTVYASPNISSAGTVSGAGKHDYSSRVTITATTNAGYTWLGWYEGETKVSTGTSLSYTFTMPAENKTYTAKFELCTNHTRDLNCICTKCGEVVHTFNANCICTKCSFTAHGTKDGQYCRHGGEIYFGSYPQTMVRDSALSSALGTYNSNTWTSYGYYKNGSVSNYMYYCDKEYNGEKYRGVYFTEKRPHFTTGSSIGSTPNCWAYDIVSSSNYKTYNTSTVYWFKYEPIKWKIVKEESGLATLVADLILDSQNYYISDTTSSTTRTDYQGNRASAYSNNYQYSTIRTWLNVTFYETAFNDLQKELIQVTNVDNSVSSTGNSSNSYACGNTNDKVFLLSYNEASTYFTSNVARQKKSTDYAKSQGLWTNTNSGSSLGNSSWWLRSPYYYYSRVARHVDFDGGADNYGYVYFTDGGVVPALVIRL